MGAGGHRGYKRGKMTAMESGKLGNGAHKKGDREHGGSLCFRGPVLGGLVTSMMGGDSGPGMAG